VLVGHGIMNGDDAEGVERVCCKERCWEIISPQEIFRISFRKRLHFRAFHALLNGRKSVTVNYT